MNLDQQPLPYTNINSKWIIHRDVKSTSVKSINIKFQENLCHFRLKTLWKQKSQIIKN